MGGDLQFPQENIADPNNVICFLTRSSISCLENIVEKLVTLQLHMVLEEIKVVGSFPVRIISVVYNQFQVLAGNQEGIDCTCGCLRTGQK